MGWSVAALKAALFRLLLAQQEARSLAVRNWYFPATTRFTRFISLEAPSTARGHRRSGRMLAAPLVRGLGGREQQRLDHPQILRVAPGSGRPSGPIVSSSWLRCSCLAPAPGETEAPPCSRPPVHTQDLGEGRRSGSTFPSRASSSALGVEAPPNRHARPTIPGNSRVRALQSEILPSIRSSRSRASSICSTGAICGR